MYLNALSVENKTSLAGNNWIPKHTVGSVYGTSYNDVFYALSGDKMFGGAGDDHYYVWDANFSISETAGSGTDTLYSLAWSAITLPQHVENLVLMGNGSTIGLGNTLSNVIVAGSASAYLDGGFGSDVLVGGAGFDIFNVSAGEGSDAIQSFTSGKDVIRLDGFNIGSLSNLMSRATQQGNDVSFNLGNGETLVVRDKTIDSFQATDFGFQNDTAVKIGTPASGPTATQHSLSGTHAGQTSNGWYAINNAWNTGSLQYGTDYTNKVSYDMKDLSTGTSFNWSFPTKTLKPGLAGDVLAYPDLLFGASPFSGGVNPGDTAKVFPVQLSKLTSLVADFDVSYGGDTGGFNVSFDIWLTSKPGGDASTVTNEIMVWLHKGDFEAFGERIGTYQDGDFAGTIYRAPGTNYTAIVANTDTPAASLDLVKLFDKLGELGIVNDSEYLAMSQLGAEVVSGAGSLTINHLNYTVQTQNADGSITNQFVTGTGTTTSIVDPLVTKQGTDGADVIDGDRNVCDLYGNGGDDVLTVSQGTSTLQGGTGNDTYILKSQADTVIERAGEGIDTVKASFSYTLGDHVENLILTGSAAEGRGNALDNAITGNGSANKLYGGAGSDSLDGGAGADFLDGGDGFDFAAYTSAASGVTVDLLSPANNKGDAVGDSYASIEGLVGSNFADALHGNNGANTLRGGAGDDLLSGRGGDDILIGGAGRDTLNGGWGSDTYMFGVGDGRDIIEDLHGWGGQKDLIKLDSALGVNSFADVLSRAKQVGVSTVITFDTGDSLVIYNFQKANLRADDFAFFGEGPNEVAGGAGDDKLVGGTRTDKLDGGAGADSLDGGVGFDYAVYRSATAGVTVDLMNALINKGDAAGDSYVSVEGLIGSGFADALHGSNGVNVLEGGTGDDYLNGRAGNDVFIGGAGRDTLNGGWGSDTFVFGKGDGRDIIEDLHGWGGDKDLIKLDKALGVASFADVLSHTKQVGISTVVTFDTGDSLVLYNKQMSTLTADDFIFFT